MLEGLFGSKVGVKILLEIGRRPYKEFYLNELSKNLKIGLGRTKTILDNLTNLKLLTKTTSGNRILFKLNENNPLSFEVIKFAHLNSLILLSEEFRTVITNFSREYKKILGENLLSIVVFGSVVKNKATELSDIDILVIIQTRPNKKINEELREAFSKILDIFARITEEKIFTDKEFTENYEMGDDFLINVMKDGIIVFDDNNFYSRFLLRGLPKITKKTIENKLNIAKHWLNSSLEMYKNNPELIASQLGVISNHLSRAILLLNNILPQSKREIPNQLKAIKENKFAQIYENTRKWFDEPPLGVDKEEVWEILMFLKEKYNEIYRKLEEWS